MCRRSRRCQEVKSCRIGLGGPSRATTVPRHLVTLVATMPMRRTSMRTAVAVEAAALILVNPRRTAPRRSRRPTPRMAAREEKVTEVVTARLTTRRPSSWRNSSTSGLQCQEAFARPPPGALCPTPRAVAVLLVAAARRAAEVGAKGVHQGRREAHHAASPKATVAMVAWERPWETMEGMRGGARRPLLDDTLPRNALRWHAGTETITAEAMVQAARTAVITGSRPSAGESMLSAAITTWQTRSAT
mmetsp:Transcript_110488/g.276624  ORF Transcript_110488/g.276624 Transcript_110488/m.276624 type:complete len:246 (+) Transcript_110488:643-1380(+)